MQGRISSIGFYWLLLVFLPRLHMPRIYWAKYFQSLTQFLMPNYAIILLCMLLVLLPLVSHKSLNLTVIIYWGVYKTCLSKLYTLPLPVFSFLLSSDWLNSHYSVYISGFPLPFKLFFFLYWFVFCFYLFLFLYSYFKPYILILCLRALFIYLFLSWFYLFVIYTV
jgi:hypothetical protein